MNPFTPLIAAALVCGVSAQNAGSSFCLALPNSSGQPAVLSGSFGSGVGSGLHLEVTQGVPGEFGLFLIGNEATPAVGISRGLLCLNGISTAAFYRYNVPGNGWGSLGQFDSAGILQNMAGTSLSGSGYDVPGNIPAGPPIQILAGQTWHFQFWYRDTPAGLGTSNFTNGLSVTFGSGGTQMPIAGMRLIPAGTFDMGSNEGLHHPYFSQSGERPVHSVTISQSFWLGATEVTQAQYEGLMGTNPSHFPGANHPVEMVTWYEARAFCTALTAQEQALGNLAAGYEYRLPTEAEWEHACRAGTTTEFNVGAELYCVDAHFYYSNHSSSTCNNTPLGPDDVGGYAPNAWGLYNMHGNVAEWCLDSFNIYSPVPATDPFVSNAAAIRIWRGGSHSEHSGRCRSAWRWAAPPSYSTSSIGFRIALGPIRIP